jgi:hypothetical protein
MKKSFYSKLIALGSIILLPMSCINNDDLLNNPNSIPESGIVPPTLILNRITSHLVMPEEFFFDQAHRQNQYFVSNYSYYWGTNFYNWTNSKDQYSLLLYANRLEEQNEKSTNANDKAYYAALSKFFKAYSFIWLSQRVGDIPMKEAGDSKNLRPKYDTQEEVYVHSLQLLEEANELLNNLPVEIQNRVADASGDIFHLTYLQWQKVINSFHLRTLISLSKRADDTPELKVKETFAKIINNPQDYPLQSSNKDNMSYVFNQDHNPNPIFRKRAYTYGANISKTILDLTTSSLDPRTYAFATPAPAKYNTEGLDVADFKAYVGVSTNTGQAEIFATTDTEGIATNDRGPYSYMNYKRYLSSQDGSNSEPYTVIGYSELCFNIAEAINRGWISGDANQWYLNGIKESLELFGLKDGQSFSIGDRTGGDLGEVNINVDQFLNHKNVAYKGNNSQGLEQIIQQKYIAFFCNSGFEAFYNWRRTGFPKFEEGGVGIGTATNKIPLRWMYPQGEITYNSENYLQAIQRQYNGSDGTFDKMWLIK